MGLAEVLQYDFEIDPTFLIRTEKARRVHLDRGFLFILIYILGLETVQSHHREQFEKHATMRSGDRD